MLKTFNRVAAATAALFCVPMAAHADPITTAIGAIATSLSSLSASTVLTGLATMALNYGASMLLGKMMQKDVKEKGVKGKLESGGDLPLSFILGEYATAGKLIYVNEYSGDLNSILVMVVSLSEMPVTSLSSFLWVNGEKTSIDFGAGTDSDGFYVVPRYQKYDNDYLKVKFYDGTQTAADAFLTSTFGSDPDKPWSSDMIGRGCAYAILQCKYSRKGVWSGIPEFKFVLRGMKLYNPAKDSTNGGSGAHRWNDQSTWEWSENPVVMKYNIIRGIYYKGQDWIFGGQNLSAYQLPSAYWIAAINHCDETVTKADDTTIKRYTAGCEISVDQQPIDIIKELDKSCAGYTTEYGGMWKTWAGPPGSSVFSFTDDDIIITEEQEDDLFRPIQELYNGVRATYTSPNQGWVSKDAPPRIFSDYETADGYSLIAEISFPFVTEPNQVQRLMRAAVLDSRKQITHQLHLPPAAYLLDTRDVVSWTSARNGYSAKKFMVIAIEDMPDFTQFVTLREINPNDYDWDTEYELPETTGPLVEVKPGALAVDFTVTADQIDNDNGGKDRPAIKVEWDWQAPDLDIRHIEYEIRRSGTTKVIKRGTFKNVMRDTDHVIEHSAFRFGKTYQIRFYPEPLRAWRDTSWTSWKSVTLFNIDVPGRPDINVRSDLANNGKLSYIAEISWTDVTATATYGLKITKSLGPFSKTFTRTSDEAYYELTVDPGWTYEVQVRAKVGPERGDWSLSRTITVNKRTASPTAPVTLTVTGGYKSIDLIWGTSPDSDFKRALIYGSKTNDFTTATIVGRARDTDWTHRKLANNATWYYWLAFQDSEDNVSSKYPASNTNGASATTSKIVDDDFADDAPDIPNGGDPPSLLVRSKVADDGTLDYSVRARFSPVANTKASYIIRIYDSAKDSWDQRTAAYDDADTVITKWWKVEDATTLTVSVAAKTAGGKVGPFTGNATIVVNAKATNSTPPTDLTVTPKALQNILYATKNSSMKDFGAFRFYGSTTGAWADRVVLDERKARRFAHNGLSSGETWTYWATTVDTVGNESRPYPTAANGIDAGAGVSGTTARVSDADVDLTDTLASVAADIETAVSDSAATLSADLAASTESLSSAISAEEAARSAQAIDLYGQTRDLLNQVASIVAEVAEQDFGNFTAQQKLQTTLVSQQNTDRASFTDQITVATAANAALATRTTALEATTSTLTASVSDIQTAYTAADTALAAQIESLTVGTTTQFDSISTWFFDSSVESWSGNGTPTASGGYLIAAASASDPYVESPSALGINAVMYGQVRLRAKKTGSPTWEGWLYYKQGTDSTWDTSRRVALTEPSWDGSGFGEITVNHGLTGTLNQIRIDLSASSDASNYIAIDWVGIGRPAPGASVASVTAEQAARIAADSAQASSIAALDSRLTTAESGVTGNASALSALTTDVSDLDGVVTAQGAAITGLTASLDNKADVSVVDALTTEINDFGGADGVNSIGGSTRTITNSLDALTGEDVDAEFAAFLASHDVRVAAAAASQSLTTNLEATNTSLSAVSQSVTALQAQIPNLASADAVASLTSRVSVNETSISSINTSLTSLTSTVAGKADSTALSALSTDVTEIDGNVTSIANALTELFAGDTAGNYSSARVQFTAVGGPDGWARYAIEVRSASSESFASAGLYLDVNQTTGSGRIVLDADQYVFLDGDSVTEAPLSVVDGVLMLGNVNIENAELGTLSIGGVNIAPGAITVDKTDSTVLAAPDPASPIVVAPKSNADASVSVSLNCTIAANVAGAVRYDVQLWASDSSGGTYAKVASQSIPTDDDGDLPIANFRVNTETYYKVKWRARNFAGAPGTWSALKGAAGGGGVRPSISTLTVSAPTGISIPYGVGSPIGGKVISVRWPAEDFASKDYSHTLLMIHTVNDSFDAGLNGLILSADAVWAFGVTYGVAFSLGGLAPGQYYAWAFNVSKAGVVTAQYPSGSGYSFTVPSVGTDQLAAGAGFARATAITGSAYGDFGTGTQTIQSVTLDHNGASFVEIYGEFKNISGATRTFSVTIETPTDTLRGRSCAVGPDEVVTITGHEVNPSGSSTVYRLRVQSDDATNDVRDRYLRAVSRR